MELRKRLSIKAENAKNNELINALAITFIHMTFVMKFAFLPTGGLCISPSFGGSVANANASTVSMIMFTIAVALP